jgi:methylmalonyl-CoA/ethylmalonyl-CoA epimerase
VSFGARIRGQPVSRSDDPLGRMGLARVDHFGIVVPKLEAALPFYATILGCSVSKPIARENQGILKAYARFVNFYVELITPVGSDSPIRNVLGSHNAHEFLQRNPGGGLHHVCYAVSNISRVLESLTKEGYRVLGNGAVVTGATGDPIVFVDPIDTSGALIELKQV